MAIRTLFGKVIWITAVILAVLANPLKNCPLFGPSPQSILIRVPQDVSDLQVAINQVSDGGVIEISGGTYYSPSGGFIISDASKSFTMRAKQGEEVVLSGGNSNEIVTFINSDKSKGGLVTFKDLIFANGYADRDGRAGAITMQRAQARFINCVFRNNQGRQPNTGGGGVLVALGSDAVFENCVWEGNSARNFGGALAVNDAASVTIYGGRFLNNRTNPSDHSQTAAGGAIHIGNSTVRIYNSEFIGNQAGYVGGAVYATGNWDRGSFVAVVNSVFENNKSISTYSLLMPTEGGAFHAEDQTSAIIYGSRFIGNEAMIGGGVNLYRARVEIISSLFQGNRATGVGAAKGFGGAISATSNDTSNDGEINQRTAYLLIRNTIISGTTGIVGQSGGGIYIAGDSNRMYGLNGVQQIGTPDDNRAKAILDNVIIFNTDVQETAGAPGTGVGGGILIDLADLTMQNSLIMASDAQGSNSSGGGIAILNNSIARLTAVTFAGNTSEKFGGALFIQGSETQLNGCKIFENQVSNALYGAAIFAAPDDGRQLDVRGWVSNCEISNNVGLPLFDDDRTNGPINNLQYNSNRIYRQDSDYVYKNALTSLQTVEGLNNLTINRQNGISTKKSTNPNLWIAQMPAVGQILGVPPFAIPSYPIPYYLGWGWSGISAVLNGAPLSSNIGLVEVAGPGVYTLTVNGASSSQSFIAEIRSLENRLYVPLVSKSF
ncbi:MAG: hypothetical protein QXH03_05520 [Candidatus Bathyarchaeia archaeon]